MRVSFISTSEDARSFPTKTHLQVPTDGFSPQPFHASEQREKSIITKRVLVLQTRGVRCESGTAPGEVWGGGGAAQAHQRDARRARVPLQRFEYDLCSSWSGQPLIKELELLRSTLLSAKTLPLKVGGRRR